MKRDILLLAHLSPLALQFLDVVGKLLISVFTISFLGLGLLGLCLQISTLILTLRELRTQLLQLLLESAIVRLQLFASTVCIL